jgi:hypothetical protein
VDLPVGGSASFSLTGTVAVTGGNTLSNTASIAAPSGIVDPNLANNSATDSVTVTVAAPTLGLLDNFNRANANTLGANWSQITIAGLAAIRVNSNQAQDQLLPGQAVWNVPVGGFGAKQGAAFTFANTTLNNSALILKATGGSAASPANFIRVLYNAGSVTVATTTNSGITYTVRATLAATFANGNTLSAVANADGSVDVWQNTTFIGHVIIPTVGVGAWTQGTAGGRIGIQLPAGARVDNFSGQTVP